MRKKCWKCNKRNPITEDGLCGRCSKSNWKIFFAAGAMLAALVFLFALSPGAAMAQGETCPEVDDIEIRDDLEARTGKSLYRVIGNDRRNLLESMDGTILAFEGYSVAANNCNVVAAIVFMSEGRINSNLFLVPLFGSGEIQRLTQTTVGEINPEYDTDLRRIRYQIKNASTQQYKLDLWADSFPLTEANMLWLEWDRTPRVLSNSLINYDRVTKNATEETEEAKEYLQEDDEPEWWLDLGYPTEALAVEYLFNRVQALTDKDEEIEEMVDQNTDGVYYANTDISNFREEFDPTTVFPEAMRTIEQRDRRIEQLLLEVADANAATEAAYDDVEDRIDKAVASVAKLLEEARDRWDAIFVWIFGLIVGLVMMFFIAVWLSNR